MSRTEHTAQQGDGEVCESQIRSRIEPVQDPAKAMLTVPILWRATGSHTHYSATNWYVSTGPRRGGAKKSWVRGGSCWCWSNRLRCNLDDGDGGVL